MSRLAVAFAAFAILAAAASLGLPAAKAQSSLEDKCDKAPVPQLTVEELHICETLYTSKAHLVHMNILLRERAARDARNPQKSAGQ